MKAAFSEEILSSTGNSDVIELSSDSYVVLHVRQRHKPKLRPLAEVREQALAAVTREVARIALEAEAVSVIGELPQGQTLEQYANTQGYQVQVELGVDRRNSKVPAAVLERIFQLPVPAAGMTEKDFVFAPNGDALVMQLMRVSSGAYKELGNTEKEQMQQMIRGEVGSLINNEFQLGLRKRAEITVL